MEGGGIYQRREGLFPSHRCLPGHSVVPSPVVSFKKNTVDDNGGYGFDLFITSGNILRENAACGDRLVDARQRSSTGNEFTRNDFCTTEGI